MQLLSGTLGGFDRLHPCMKVLPCMHHNVAIVTCRHPSQTVMCPDSCIGSACRLFYLPLFLLLLAVAHGSTARGPGEAGTAGPWLSCSSQAISGGC